MDILMKLRLAELTVEIQNRFPFVEQQCAAYATDGKAELTISVTAEELAAERAQADAPYPDGYLESICAYRKLCLQLPAFDGFLLHAAVIAVDGAGFAFAAPSGVGKSTHIRLWQEVYGDRVTIVNGDKPIVRRVDGVWRAYGTPWCGKENWQTNRCVPVNAVCFLQRSKTDAIRRMPLDEAIPQLFEQLLPLTEDAQAAQTFALLEDFVAAVPFYQLGCTPTVAAVQTAAEAFGVEA